MTNNNICIYIVHEILLLLLLGGNNEEKGKVRWIPETVEGNKK